MKWSSKQGSKPGRKAEVVLPDSITPRRPCVGYDQAAVQERGAAVFF